MILIQNGFYTLIISSLILLLSFSVILDKRYLLIIYGLCDLLFSSRLFLFD